MPGCATPVGALDVRWIGMQGVQDLGFGAFGSGDIDGFGTRSTLKGFWSSSAVLPGDSELHSESRFMA